MRFASAFLVLVCAVPVRADTLGDVKAAVAGLRATAPVRATVEMQRVTVDKSKKPAATITGGAVVDALVDGEGLHVAYGPALLARVAKEQSQRQDDDELPAPTTGAVRELGPLAIVDQLDFARQLSGILNKSALVSEKRLLYEGRPARLLALKVKNPPPKTPIGHVEILEDSLNIWVGDDNVPLAAQRTERMSGGILFLKFEAAQSSHWTFGRKDDRLLATRSEEKNSTSGFGQNRDETQIITVSLR